MTNIKNSSSKDTHSTIEYLEDKKAYFVIVAKLTIVRKGSNLSRRLFPLFIFLIFIGCTKRQASSPVWKVIGNMPEARSDFSAVLSSYYITQTGISENESCGLFPYIERWDTSSTGDITASSIVSELSRSSAGFNADAVVYQSHIYLFGGEKYVSCYGPYESSSLPDRIVQYAQINQDGALGLWQSTTSMLTPRVCLEAVMYNGWVYVLGGLSPTGITNSVEYAQVMADGTLGQWQTTTSMNIARTDFGAVAISGWVYAVGGSTLTGVTDTVEIAQIQPDGSLGNWSFTSQMDIARTGFGIAGYNGWIYVIAGTAVTSPAGVSTNTVEMAHVHPDGSLGNWMYAAPMNVSPIWDWNLSITIAENRIYVPIYGGQNYYFSIPVADINSDGSLAPWQYITATSLTPQMATTVNYQNHVYLLGGIGCNSFEVFGPYPYDEKKIYIVGGNAPSPTSSIAYADISGETIGGWHETENLWESREGASAFGGYGDFYILGGSNIVGSLGNVEYMYGIEPQGGLEKGIIVGSSYNVPQGSTSVSNDYNCTLYVVGGEGDTGYLGTVERLIRSSGTLFPFFLCGGANSIGPFGTLDGTGLAITDQTETSLNVPRYKPSAAIYNGYVYALGGYYTGTFITNSVEMAQVQTDGTLGQWRYTSPMNLPRAGFAAVAISGWVYAVGGYTDKGITNTVEKALINPDGTLGKWTFTTPMTIPRADLAVVQDNGWIYALGGISTANSAPLDTIEAMKVY